MAEFTPSSRTNPCGVCNRGAAGAQKKGPDCRLMSDGIWLCHSELGEGLKPGDPAPKKAPYRFLRTSDEAQGFGIWKPEANWEERTTTSGSMPARLPKEWQQAAATSTRKISPNTSKRTVMAEPQPLPITTAIQLARLPEPGELPPASLPNGKKIRFSATQYNEQVVDEEGNKAAKPRHQPRTGETVLSAGPDHWPFYGQNNATTYATRGDLWVLELEGPKCAMWAEAGGVVAISHPGHALALEALLRRYQELKAAGTAGVVYIADNDTTGQKKGLKLQAAATDADLPFLIIPASSIWPNKLPAGGSIDDAPGSTADRIAAIEQVIPKAVEKHNADIEDERLPTYDELIASALKAQKKEDTNRFMEVRAQLIGRFRAQDSLIREDMLKLLKLQQCGRTDKSPPPQDGVALRKVEALEYQLDGFIMKGDQSVIAGDTFTGKTMLMLALVDAHVRGKGFLDRAANECQPGKALFIAQDSGPSALLESFRKLGIDYENDPIYQQGHPQQRVWVWGYEPDQGQMGWDCGMAGLIRLKTFIEKNGITFAVGDSAKAVTAPADIEYEINKEVKALLSCTRDVICKPTGCHFTWVTHPGHGSNLVAGAKAWQEDPSMVCILTANIDENGKRLGNKLWFKKNRADPPETEQRTIYYGLEGERFVLQEGQQPEVQCSEAVLESLWQFHQADKVPVPVQQLIQLVFQRHEHSEKTVRNNLHRLTRGKARSVLSPKRGYYSLTPVELQRREARAGIQQDLPLPVDDGPATSEPAEPEESATGGSSDGPKQGENGVFPIGGGCSKGQISSKPQLYQQVSDVPTEFSPPPSGQISPQVAGQNSFVPTPTPEQTVGILQTPVPASDSPVGCPVSHSPHVRARPTTPDPVIAAITNPDPSAWQPIAFRSYRNDQISEGLKPNDLVRSGPDGGIYRLKLITSNNSWQATTGKLVPIAPGWQFLRPIPPVGTAVEISTSKGWKNGYLLEVASPDAAMQRQARWQDGRCYVTSLRTTAKALLWHVRDRWSIENSWHWPRDTQLKEDAHRYRESNGVQILATLRSLAGFWSITEGLAALAHHIPDLLALLGWREPAQALSSA